MSKLDWQPIESAPRDGTRILANDDDGCNSYIVWWCDGWCDDDYSATVRPRPVLWHPLPTDPPRYTLTQAGRAALGKKD